MRSLRIVVVSWEGRVCRGDNSRRGELGDGDVIGMSVSTVGGECHDHIRLNAPDVPCNDADHHTWVGAVEMLVAVIQQRDFAHAQDRRGGAQLGFTYARQRRRTWMLVILGSKTTVAAVVTARGSQQKNIDAL